MKAFSADQHLAVCGQPDNAQVFEFARRLAALKRPMWLRYVLVPGLTDVESEMVALADFAAGLGVVERVEVLPFHQMGRYKWENLGLDYTLNAVEPPSAAQVAKAVGIFRGAGLEAV
jgi:pyruvate formate lyase activating enzyme